MTPPGARRELPAFHWSSADELTALAEALGVSVPVGEDVAVLARSVRAGELTAPNSLAVHPMEGCDADGEGRPGELTVRRYERFAAGGAGLLWVEAIAVLPEGRANPRQLWLHDGNVASFAALVRRIREVAAREHGASHRPLLVAQLTHSGRYARPDGTARPLITRHDPHRDERMGLPPDHPVATDEQLDALQGAFVSAARLAFEAGFDAVDVKACHGYLISELLASYERPGRYGGSFENRARFLLEVIDRIHAELGEDKPAVTRLGVYDGIPHPYGWGVDRDDPTRADLAEPLELVARLAARRVPMVNVTLASPYYNPHYGRPCEKPASDAEAAPEHPLVGVARAIGLAGEVQRAFPDVAVVGTGYSWLRALFPCVAAGAKASGLATFIGAGRLALAYPNFAADILREKRLDPGRVCVTCSGCTQIMRDGGTTGCVVRDADIYGPILREGRKARERAGA